MVFIIWGAFAIVMLQIICCVNKNGIEEEEKMFTPL
jgi:hypothetical protein